MIPNIDNRLFNLKIKDISFSVFDIETSLSAPAIANELSTNDYQIESIPFEKGDIIVDIGAHIGIVDIYLLKKFPFLKVISFEPNSINYNNLIRNIEFNQIHNITVYNLGITKDSREIELTIPMNNTGGGNAYVVEQNIPSTFKIKSKTTTLNNVFQTIDSCKLLKIDCEGAEFEIAESFKFLDRVKNISMEIHDFGNITHNSNMVDNLINTYSKVPHFFYKIAKHPTDGMY